MSTRKINSDGSERTIGLNKDYLSARCLGIAHNDPKGRPASHKDLVDALGCPPPADLRWMRCGCADACAQFDGVREARDAFAMLSHPKTDLTAQEPQLLINGG